MSHCQCRSGVHSPSSVWTGNGKIIQLNFNNIRFPIEHQPNILIPSVLPMFSIKYSIATEINTPLLFLIPSLKWELCNPNIIPYFPPWLLVVLRSNRVVDTAGYR